MVRTLSILYFINPAWSEEARTIAGGFSAPHLDARSDSGAGFQDARAAYSHGGRILRVFYTPRMFSEAYESILASTRIKKSSNSEDIQRLKQAVPDPTIPVYMDSMENRLAILDHIDKQLDLALKNITLLQGPDGAPLDTTILDRYVIGVAKFNDTLPVGASPIRVLLSPVMTAPQDILEAPSTALLGFFKRPYTFATLWDKYVRANIALTRLVIGRYATTKTNWDGQPREPVVTAIELINEPDYNFIPDENRIEEAIRPEGKPIDKYVTELHLSQIPRTADSGRSYETTPWGFQEQQSEWAIRTGKEVSVTEYDWGSKFDWYVKGIADLMRHMAFAAKQEANSSGSELVVISGGVTHVNIDFLIRMYRQNSEVFRWVDAIGIHPYHWPNHDIWDKHFVRGVDKSGWKQSNPNEFAASFLKHFDFLEELAKLTRLEPTDPNNYGMSGKRIWVTEFGIGTKKLGVANRPLAPFIKFIKQRGEPALDYPSVDWEDLWDAFFDQIDTTYLRKKQY